MKKKRMFILVISLFLTMIVVAALITGIVHFVNHDNDEGEPSENNIRYHLPNYDENIFNNTAYMSFQRDLRYSALGVENYYSYEKDYESAPRECRFFLDYFNTVINGKYEDLASFYVEGYFEEEPKFTMQMIYEPYVYYHSVSTDEIDGVETELINFKVEYRIFKNNGTFRKGVSSNVKIPQIYQLIKMSNGSYRIYRILEIQIAEE